MDCLESLNKIMTPDALVKTHREIPGSIHGGDIEFVTVPRWLVTGANSAS